MGDRSYLFESWYRSRAPELAKSFEHVAFKRKDWDPLLGGVVLELKSPNVLATITLWFKGDIEIGVLPANRPEPLYLDDGRLEPDEDIAALLDARLEQILTLGSTANPC